MFEPRIHRTTASSATGILELIYHSTVRQVRKGHKSGGLGLVTNIIQALLLIAVFYGLFYLLGMRSLAIRGDFLLYLMSGVFLFLVFVKTIDAVYGAPGPTSAMMLHAPMNTAISVAAAALASLYLQVLTIVVILFIYHAAIQPISIQDPLGASAMVLLTWFSGVSFGLLLLAARPWAPGAVGLIHRLFIRINMLASGKMFVANTIPGFLLPLFSWNPLFHTIDQTRGFVFLNYNPHYTSIGYPLLLSLGIIMVALMGEFYTRQHASASWGRR